MMNRTHNSELDVRTLAAPRYGCVGLSGWFSNFQ